MNKKINYVVILSILFLLVDQGVKYILSKYLELGKSIKLIKDVLNLTLVHNDGAAFNLFPGNRLFLVIVGVFATVLILFYINKKEKLTKFNITLYSLLIGGVLGNLVDRIVNGYVIDYVHFIFNNHSFPVFNFADVCIVISIILLILRMIKEDLCKSK